MGKTFRGGRGNSSENNNRKSNAREGGRKGESSRGELPRSVQVSKNLSFLLRHGAEKQGVIVDTGGWANVDDVVGRCHLIPLHFSLRKDRRREVLSHTRCVQESYTVNSGLRTTRTSINVRIDAVKITQNIVPDTGVMIEERQKLAFSS